MLFLSPASGVAEEQLAIVSPGNAPSLPANRLDDLGRNSWTALPSSSVAGVTRVSAESGFGAGPGTAMGAQYVYSTAETRRPAGVPLAWRLDLDGPLHSEVTQRRVRGAGYWAKRKRRWGLHRRELFAGLDLDFEGDYSRPPRPMRDGLRVVEGSKLLRWGAVLNTGGWKIGGAFGNKPHPIRPDEELSWNASARYDKGPLSLGLVYSYTIDNGVSDGSREDMLGTLQGGVSYAITSKISASLNAAYWDSVNEYGRTETDLGGLVGFSWRF